MTWSIIVHGGAGAIDPLLAGPHQSGCRRAAKAGALVLAGSGSSLDAVCAAVRVLEDEPIFNAGTGSALDERGWVTCDAAVMRGSDLAYGAVGAVAGIKNPVDLARAILEDGRHSLLVGVGAVAFARRHGIPRCDPASLITGPGESRWWATRAEVGDTVGAAALDTSGTLAAATSTGGLLGKYADRVGDAPIAGAGTYARNDLGAASATGHGESILKTVLTYQSLLALGRGGDASAVLAGELDTAYARVRGRAGIIAVLPDGRVASARNTPHMGFAWIRHDGSEATGF